MGSVERMPDLRATYRLQLSPDFGFAAARELVPYLRELGVSHLYLSPSLQAREGSTHGYDVVDPTKVSEALGGEDELRALAAEMPLILDIVPNHMGTGDENRWWPDREGVRLRARHRTSTGASSTSTTSARSARRTRRSSSSRTARRSS